MFSILLADVLYLWTASVLFNSELDGLCINISHSSGQLYRIHITFVRVRSCANLISPTRPIFWNSIPKPCHHSKREYNDTSASMGVKEQGVSTSPRRRTWVRIAFPVCAFSLSLSHVDLLSSAVTLYGPEE